MQPFHTQWDPWQGFDPNISAIKRQWTKSISNTNSTAFPPSCSEDGFSAGLLTRLSYLGGCLEGMSSGILCADPRLALPQPDSHCRVGAVLQPSAELGCYNKIIAGRVKGAGEPTWQRGWVDLPSSGLCVQLCSGTGTSRALRSGLRAWGLAQV